MKKKKNSPITAPRTRVLARITNGLRESDVVHFPTPEMKALYFAARVEAPSCWPRVLEGAMTQERFNERQKRMMAAILAATA